MLSFETLGVAIFSSNVVNDRCQSSSVNDSPGGSSFHADEVGESKHRAHRNPIENGVASTGVQGRSEPERATRREGAKSLPSGHSEASAICEIRAIWRDGQRARGCEASPKHPKAAGGNNFRRHLRCPGLDTQRTRSGHVPDTSWP